MVFVGLILAVSGAFWATYAGNTANYVIYAPIGWLIGIVGVGVFLLGFATKFDWLKKH